MPTVSIDIPKEENEKPIYTQKDLIKDGFGFVNASVDEVVAYAVKNFDLDANQISAFRGVISNIKMNAIGGILDWDSSKTLGENISHVSGTLIQDGGITLGVGLMIPGPLLAFTVTVIVGAGLKYAGINLGDELQDLYSEYIDTSIKVSSITQGGGDISNLEDSFLVNQVKKLEELETKLNDIDKKVQDYLEKNPSNENNPIEVEVNQDNSIEIKNSDNSKSVISDNTQTNYNSDGNLVSSVSLKPGQTISHIAAGTKFSTQELLQFNGLSEADARNLPVGFEIQIPKSINTFEGGYGNIKVYEGQDGSLTYHIPADEQGTIKIIKLDSNGNVIENEFDTVEDINNATNEDILTAEQQKYIEENSVAYKKDKEEEKVKEETHERENEAIGGAIGGSIGGSIGSIIIGNNDFSNIGNIAIDTGMTTIGQNVGEYLFFEGYICY